MKVFNIVCALLLVAAPAAAVDLGELQEMALAKREVIKRYMIDQEKSEKDTIIARSGYLPSLDATYQANMLDESNFAETRENSTFITSVTWNLFNGFRDKYQIEASELLTQVEELQLDAIRQDIQLDVALRYLEVYERQANLEVARKNYETLKKIYEDGKNRLEVGLIDRNELLKFKVDLDDSFILVEAAKGGLEKSVILLGRTVGEDVTLAQLEFDIFDDIPGSKSLPKNRALMLARKSELEAFERLIEAQRDLRRVAEGGYYPRVDLVGSYRYFDDAIISGSGDTDDTELRAQLRLSMNLYQGGATQADVAKARLETQGLLYDYKERKDTLLTELQNLHIDYRVSLRNIEVALAGIEQAEENLRITRLKYDEGLQRESDLLDAVANLSRARYNYVAVLQNVFLNHFRILRMVEAF